MLRSSMAAMLEMFLLGVLFFLSITLTAGGWSYCQPGPFVKGQYLDSGSNICQPCQPGHYMDLENHACLSCFKCLKPEDHHQIILQNCSADSSSKLGCVDGYYYIEDGDKREVGSCEKCSKCGDQCVAVPCENVTDVLCCSCKYTVNKREPPEASQCDFSRQRKVISNQTPPKIQVIPVETTTRGPDVSKDFKGEHVGREAEEARGPSRYNGREAEEASGPSRSQDSPGRTLNDGFDFEDTRLRLVYLVFLLIIFILLVVLVNPAARRFLLAPLKGMFKTKFFK